jgi:hypothetical protein
VRIESFLYADIITGEQIDSRDRTGDRGVAQTMSQWMPLADRSARPCRRVR